MKNSDPQNGDHTVVFEWKPEDFSALLDSCGRDDGVQLSVRVLPKSGRILEAGCGTGRVVKYFHDLGYEIEGIELNGEIIRTVHSLYPELRLTVGDVACVPVPDNYYSGLLSYGVIEHFIGGIEPPLNEHYRVLAPGGIAVITVPSLNTVRKIKYALDVCLRRLNPRMNNLVRRALGHQPMRRNVRGRDGFQYHVHPQFLGFFEYRLTPAEFEQAVTKAGFRILESLPISHMDGLFHELNPGWVSFVNWKFQATPPARSLNRLLSKIPWFHNHMHAIVATK